MFTLLSYRFTSYVRFSVHLRHQNKTEKIQKTKIATPKIAKPKKVTALSYELVTLFFLPPKISNHSLFHTKGLVEYKEPKKKTNAWNRYILRISNSRDEFEIV